MTGLIHTLRMDLVDQVLNTMEFVEGVVVDIGDVVLAVLDQETGCN